MQNSILKTHRHELWGKFMKAIQTYEMVKPEDHIAVCISGGKDSMLLGLLFKIWSSFANIEFKVSYIVMDPGYQACHRQQIKDNAERLGLPIEIFDTSIFDLAQAQTKSPCYRCASMRRGALYHFAQELGCNKIALGHHYDDVIETTLMNQFYGGQIGTMMPRLKAQNYEAMELIRPLYFVREQAIINWATRQELTFLNCACVMTDQRAQDSKRAYIKQLIQTLKKENPFIEANLFKSMEHVNLNKLISYHDDEQTVAFLDKIK